MRCPPRLQADAYAGFNEIYGTGRVVSAICWAHARRKFHDLSIGTSSPLAKEALRRIGLLYDIERAIHGLVPEERLKARQKRAKPLLDTLEKWMYEQLGKLSRKSAAAEAIQYSLGRGLALMCYCGDGRIEIDNNAAERALRAVAIGRKNYLFAGSDTGGERAAAIYTLIGTAKLNGVDPAAYLRFVLERIADHPIKRIADLLPWNVDLPKPDQIRPAA